MSTSLYLTVHSARRRAWTLAIGGMALTVGALAAACLVVSFFGIPLPSFSPGPPSLAKSLAQTIDAQGIDAAAVRYQSLSSRGFSGYLENENQINDLGYALLGKHQPAAAVQILALNARTHAKSANAFDSLGEAQAATGDIADAIASYRHALELDPNFRSSSIALAKLTGVPRKPLLPLVLLHITGGLASIVFGFAALVFKKGGRWHRWTGTAFFIAMLIMAGDAGFLAVARNEPTNILAAFFTLYMVLTAWLAARRRVMRVDLLNIAGLLVAWVITVAGIGFGLQAADQHASLIPFIGFSAAALIATVTDFRVIVAGGIIGSQRIARHIWRMCTGLFIAVSSFFLGQSQFVPHVIRDYNLAAIPPILVVLALLYWMGKNLWQRRSARRPAASLPNRQDGSLDFG